MILIFEYYTCFRTTLCASRARTSRCRYGGNRRTGQKTSWIANAIELDRHTTLCENTWECDELKLLFFFPYPPED